MKLLSTTLVLFLTLISSAFAQIQTQRVEYKTSGGAVSEGYLVYDESFKGNRPGVVLFHEWWGLNEYIKSRAELLAKLGYTVLAADIYGKGVRPSTVEEATAESSKYKNDRELLREQSKAALNALLNSPNVDTHRVVAMGYCFGGMAALELARSGADLKAVVSIHGDVSTPKMEDNANIKGKVLILHGEDDSFVSNEQVNALDESLKSANVEHQIIKYPGAVHGFTNPANKGEIKGVLYNKDADNKSWNDMQEFLGKNL